MKILLLSLLITSTTALANMEKSAYEHYSAVDNYTNKVDITWEISDNIQKTCDNIRIKVTGKPYPYTIDACSEWSKIDGSTYKCRIITTRTPNNDIVGHEIRHCFQGDFH